MITFSQHRKAGQWFWLALLECDAITCRKVVCDHAGHSDDADAMPEQAQLLQLRTSARLQGWTFGEEGAFCPDCSPTHASPTNDRR